MPEIPFPCILDSRETCPPWCKLHELSQSFVYLFTDENKSADDVKTLLTEHANSLSDSERQLEIIDRMKWVRSTNNPADCIIFQRRTDSESR